MMKHAPVRQPLRDFRPHPFYRGGHLQTLIRTWRGPLPAELPAEPLQIPLDDGDQLVAHENLPAISRPGAPLAILVHGLCGNHSATYLVRLAKSLLGLGIPTWRLDLRGCGAAFDLCRSTTHAGRSSDLLTAARVATTRFPEKPLWFVGVSLGGNQLLKLLGENYLSDADQQVRSKIARAVAVAPPIDLIRCSENLERWSRRAYGKFFVRRMLATVPPQVRTNPAWDESRLHPKPRTLREFDEALTAPLGGFASAEDYYRQAAAYRHVSQIRTPTFVIAASDDPLIPVPMIRDAPWSASTQIEITRSGGHVGYVGLGRHDKWLEQRIVDWLITS